VRSVAEIAPSPHGGAREFDCFCAVRKPSTGLSPVAAYASVHFMSRSVALSELGALS
jgi:hypothetical protein